MTGLINSATIKLQGIEMDILEEHALSQIVADYAFANTGALRDFLLAHGRRDLWSKAQHLRPTLQGRPPARTARTAPTPTSPPKEAPVRQTHPEQYTDAAGARSWSDGRPITFGDRVWSYIVHGEASPKKRTAGKAKKVREAIEELIALVDAEAEEVKALKRIHELERQLAEEKAKLKGEKPPERESTSAAEVRAWARENYLGHVPERGAMPKAIYDAYAEAHR